jgi:hypothetical protein
VVRTDLDDDRIFDTGEAMPGFRRDANKRAGPQVRDLAIEFQAHVPAGHQKGFVLFFVVMQAALVALVEGEQFAAIFFVVLEPFLVTPDLGDNVDVLDLTAGLKCRGKLLGRERSGSRLLHDDGPCLVGQDGGVLEAESGD